MKNIYLFTVSFLLLTACTKEKLSDSSLSQGDLALKESLTFKSVSSIDLGDEGASEISAFDPTTKKLFVVNNGGVNKIDVLDLSDPATPQYLSSIAVAPFGGFVNSVAVYDGKLAAAIEASDKVSNGKAVVFNTTDYSVIAQVMVGALPDMITFSPDGKLLLTANEGEPNDSYTIDPVGTVSIIDVENNYAVKTIGFGQFASQEATLKAQGLRIFGLNASFEQDLEPEYIAVSSNSHTAWVTLQENNAVARIDLKTKEFTDIFPLGFKSYNTIANAIDPSDRDNMISFNLWPVKGMYQPDGIAVIPSDGTPFIYVANEGDARDYSGFSEVKRIKDNAIQLDPGAFPNAAALKQDAQLGRLNITTTLGDTDGDGDYDELYSFGGRSFSIWNGNNGKMVFDSKNELDKIAASYGKYDDGRSDDKGAEPENITIGRVGNHDLLFVVLERADAIVVYDITNPVKPSFLQFLSTNDAPEGVLFVQADKSPTGKALLIASNEGDGVVNIFSAE